MMPLVAAAANNDMRNALGDIGNKLMAPVNVNGGNGNGGGRASAGHGHGHAHKAAMPSP